MAHHGMQGFEEGVDDGFDPALYSTPISNPLFNEHHFPLFAPYAPQENYAFQFSGPDMMLTTAPMYNTLQSTGVSPYEPGFDGRLLTATMAGQSTSMPMALDATHAVAPTYAAPWQMQPGWAAPDLYWAPPPNWEDGSYPMPQGLTSGPPIFPQSATPSQEAARSGPSGPPASRSAGAAVSHRLIRPKHSSAVKGPLPPHEKPTSRQKAAPYTSIYSRTGFDIVGVLAEVVSRPDPKVHIGAVDLSCAFVLCDILAEDHPIVYVSQAFERLTGYAESEIVGQKCRFLQSPNGVVRRGMQRKFVDTHTAFRLRTTIEERTEIQVSIINYRKGGQSFMNLITLVPIRLHYDDYRFYVGFQVDLVEKPDAVARRNPNGTYMIDYQRNQLPTYVVPPALYQVHPDLMTQFSPEQVSMILRSLDNPGPNYRGYLDRVLVENADDMIHVLSFEGELLYFSPSCRRCLAYEPVELVGKTLSMVCHPYDIGPVSRELWAQTTTDPVSVAYRIRKKDSGYVWLESRGSWHIGQGRRQFMVLVGRVRPIYHLGQIAQLGGGTLAETDIWMKLSASGIILFASSKARPVLGHVPDDLVGKSLPDLIDGPQEVRRALDVCSRGNEARVGHRIRHQRGHMLAAQTTLFPGDVPNGGRPSFLVAQIRFPSSETERPSGEPPTTTQGDSHPNDFTQGPGNQSGSTIRGSSPQSLFRELSPTRGSHWQFELHALAQQNKTLSEEVHELLAQRKKRKRRLSTIPAGKSCTACHTRRTPEWRRGPSGNRDLCNSCGLRWAKQVRTGQGPGGHS